jgi:hypothetical protein
LTRTAFSISSSSGIFFYPSHHSKPSAQQYKNPQQQTLFTLDLLLSSSPPKSVKMKISSIYTLIAATQIVAVDAAIIPAAGGQIQARDPARDFTNSATATPCMGDVAFAEDPIEVRDPKKASKSSGASKDSNSANFGPFGGDPTVGQRVRARASKKTSKGGAKGGEARTATKPRLVPSEVNRRLDSATAADVSAVISRSSRPGRTHC